MGKITPYNIVVIAGVGECTHCNETNQATFPQNLQRHARTGRAMVTHVCCEGNSFLSKGVLLFWRVYVVWLLAVAASMWGVRPRIKILVKGCKEPRPFNVGVRLYCERQHSPRTRCWKNLILQNPKHSSCEIQSFYQCYECWCTENKGMGASCLASV